MAEAAAAVAAYEVVETTAQVGVGAYMVAKPTMPLKATFSQIATSSDDNTKLSLSRSGHTLSIVKNKAYIFGGETAAGKLAGTEVHAITLDSTSEKHEPDYALLPAVAHPEGGKLPQARRNHAACAFNICVAIFGGVDESGQVIDDSTIWLFNTGRPAWETLEASNPENSPSPRHSAQLFDHQNNLLLYGGISASGEALTDVWHFDYVSKAWTRLPDAPVATSNAALSEGVLYTLSATEKVSGDLHALPLTAKADEGSTWTTTTFPTNPLAPGPQSRTGAGLLPISTGHGRQYLLYMFGSRSEEPAETAGADPEAKDAPPEFWSDMWTYQLPSTHHEAKANLFNAMKPARIKDAIRGALGVDDGKNSWGEVTVMPPSDMEASEGKVHPGPRAAFAGDVMKDGKTVVIWGGVNPKGEREGDGWMIKLE